MSAEVDICLLLEGTYPYVRGGVSGWVHELIRGLPEVKFGLAFLGGTRGQYGKQAYALPANVAFLEHAYLLEPAPAAGRPRAAKVNEAAFSDSALFHEHLRSPELGPMPEPLLDRVALSVGSRRGIPKEHFLHSERAWEEITARYKLHCTDPSFTDYFWTVRTMHLPLFGLAALSDSLPPARAYHAISTGYAGFLGALLHRKRKRPLLVTEHGIYTKERKIDLAQATWIREPPGREGSGYLRELWIRFFEGLGKLAYASANPIVSLYEGNRARQIADGAEAARTQVVPNGIDVQRFAKLRARRPAQVPKVLGLLGRVVPIKDVRTFVRAMRSVCDVLPEAEGWIIGPTDEDPAYFRDCEQLAASLGLEGKVKFLGFQDPDEILPRLGALVLTSISEALPLVLLEAFASGLPALSTDVGACREIIEGGRPDDRALGAAGAVVPISDPEATAREAIALLSDETRWSRAQAAGIARVERYYTRELMLDRYRSLYQEAAAWPASASS